MGTTYPDLKAYLAATKHRQVDLASELGVSPGHLNLIIHGHKQPSLPLAVKLSERCRVPLRSLLREA